MAADIKDWSANDLENLMLDDINLSREQGGEVAKLMGAIKRKFDDVDLEIAGVAGAYTYKGTVDTVDDLPMTGNDVGDVYNVTTGDAQGNYAWDGAQWDKTGDSLVDVDGAQVLAKESTTKRTLGERFADVVNVKDFGAKGDGVTDDTAAFEAAAASSFHSIYIPAGTYILSKQIVFEKPVSIYGSGMIRTKLVWTSDAETSGLYIDSNSQYDPTIVKDLSLLTAQTNVGTALTIDYSSLVNGDNVSFPRAREHVQILNVLIEGKDLYFRNGWQSGVYLKDCMGCLIFGCRFNGYINADTQEVSSSGFGVKLGKNGLPCCIYIQNTKISAFTIGIQSEDLEGVYVSVCDIVNCIYGVHVVNQVIEPYVCIANSHLNCRLQCIHLVKSGQISISGCDLYLEGEYSAATKQSIYLDACSVGSIYGNSFNRFPNVAGEWVGIDCNNYSVRMNIIGNSFYDQGTAPLTNKGIYLSNALYYKIGGNTFANFPEDKTVVQNSTADISFMSPDQSQTYDKVRFATDNRDNNYRLYVNLRSENDTYTKTYYTFDPGIGIYPAKDNALPLGQPSLRYSHLYCADGTIQTSDARLKQEIKDVSESVMHAWSNVKFKQFLFNDSVKEKGVDKARIHIGVIAQNIKESFDAEGIDAFKFGLLCYDEWEDEYEEFTIVDQEPEFDEKGNIVKQAKMHTEKRKTLEAGTRFSVRYDEALALECAYQRWLGEKRDARIAALEGIVNGNNKQPS